MTSDNRDFIVCWYEEKKSGGLLLYFSQTSHDKDLSFFVLDSLMVRF
jgi:hypothetical protein